MTDLILFIAFVVMLKYIIDSIRMIKPTALEFAGATIEPDQEKPTKKKERPKWEEFLSFKKGDMDMPEPDPAIGESALANIELGQAQLDFNKQQYADLMERQEKTDALASEVANSQLEAMRQATDWAKEDRQIAADYREKFDAYADEDRAKGQEYRDQMDAMSEDIRTQGQDTANRFGEIADKQGGFSDEQMARYREGFAPLEDQYAKDAADWDSEANKSKAAAEAKSGVLSNAEQQRQQSERRMASMGIDPRSGRYAGVNQTGETNTALAAAGAQNAARTQKTNEAMALKRDAINVGQQVQATGQQASSMESAAVGNKLNATSQGNSQALQAKNLGLAASGLGNTAASMGMSNQGAGYTGVNTGIGAGSTALNTDMNATNGVYNAGNVMNQGFAGAMNGNSSGAGILGNLYGQKMDAYNADQAAAGAFWGGMGSIVGQGIGMWATGGASGGAEVASSEEYKEDKKPMEYSALKAVEQMPVESWSYKKGIADEGEHIGPYAEDFNAATGKGDGKSIPMQDMMGLQLKAIQELGLEVKKLKKKSKPYRNEEAEEAEYEEIA